VRPKHQSQTKEPAITYNDRSAVVDEVIAGYETLMQRLADSHAPEFLEIAITMPQAKLLYLLGAAGELHMSDLVHRLGVSLSTISGLVDKVVDQGLASRREDPADRRQVVVALTPAGRDFIDRFRELNARQMRELLELLGDDDLASMRDALAALATAAAKLANTTGSASPRPAATARKDPE
jgi:DNA-binding MarR family transcriptional regulator